MGTKTRHVGVTAALVAPVSVGGCAQASEPGTEHSRAETGDRADVGNVSASGETVCAPDDVGQPDTAPAPGEGRTSSFKKPYCGEAASEAIEGDPCDASNDGYARTAEGTLLQCRPADDGGQDGSTGYEWQFEWKCGWNMHCRAGWYGEEPVGYCEPYAPIKRRWRDPCLVGVEEGSELEDQHGTAPACVAGVIGINGRQCDRSKHTFACDARGWRTRCVRVEGEDMWTMLSGDADCPLLNRICMSTRCSETRTHAVCGSPAEFEDQGQLCQLKPPKTLAADESAGREEGAPCDPDDEENGIVACAVGGRTLVCKAKFVPGGVGGLPAIVQPPQYRWVVQSSWLRKPPAMDPYEKHFESDECEVSAHLPDGQCNFVTCRGARAAKCQSVKSYIAYGGTIADVACPHYVMRDEDPLLPAKEYWACPKSQRGKLRCNGRDVFYCDPDDKIWREVASCPDTACRDDDLEARFGDCAPRDAERRRDLPVQCLWKLALGAN